MLALPRVIGHRGAALSAPENTLASFRRAALLGARWVELDVQLTRDGRPVVFHDHRLDRTSSGHGPLAGRDLAELAGLDAGSWFSAEFAGEPIPTLAQALEVISGLGLGVNVEIKADEAHGAETARVALAEARMAWPSAAPVPLVSSFARSALAEARRAAPDWPRGFLAERLPPDWDQAVAALGCASVHLGAKGLTGAEAGRVTGAGLALLAWTVNDRDEAERIWGLGACAVFSDCPDRLLGI